MWFDDPPPAKKSKKKKTTGRKKTAKRGSSQKPTLLSVRGRKKKATRKQSSKGNRHLAMASVFLFVFIGLIWLLVSGTRLLANRIYADNDNFLIDQVLVNNPGGRLQSAHITDYAGLSDLDNLFALSLKDIQANLEAVPLVKKVVVRRELPGTLQIDIEERSPIARLGLENRGYHLSTDVDGVVLGPSVRTPYLPAILGLRRAGLRPGHHIEMPSFLDALELIDITQTSGLASQIQFESIDIGHPEHLDLRLKGDVRVIIPRESMEGKIRKLSDLLYEASRDQKRLSYLNLMSNNAVGKYH